MIRIPDEMVKKGCSILTILEDGSSCLYKYPPGYLLSPSVSNNQCPISLMENTNSSRTEAGLIAVLCTENPATIEFGAISHEIILCQGVAFDPIIQDLVLVFHKWKHCLALNRFDLLNSNVSNESIADGLFDDEPSTMRIQKGSNYIMYFNQLTGPKHHSFISSIKLSRHKSGAMVYESALSQDNWGNRRYKHKTIETKFQFLRFAPRSVNKYASSVNVSNRPSRIGAYAGQAKLVHDKSSSILALYCLHVGFGDVKGFFFQPIPQPSLHRKLGEYQDFCLLTAKQCKTLDERCMKQHINIHEFIEYMNVLTIANGKGFVRVHRMYPQDNHKQRKYIVSLIKDPLTEAETNTKVFAVAFNGSPYVWSEERPHQSHDCDLPHGFPLGHFFPSTLSKFLTIPMIWLISLYIKCKGLRRAKTNHTGSFHIIGTRHSKMSSRTMAQYNQDQHQYNNSSNFILPLGPWVKCLFNAMMEHVTIMQCNCGMLMDGLCKKVDHMYNKTYSICKGWGIVTSNCFSNTYHKDDDFDKRYYDEVVEYIHKGNARLIGYLDRYRLLFPNLHLKKYLPLSTCCCWVYEKQSTEWVHIQYFVLLDVGLAFDLSSDMFKYKFEQLTGCFYGGLFGHLTSRSTWISKDGMFITTVCPTKGFWIFGWGRYSSQKKRQTQI